MVASLYYTYHTYSIVVFGFWSEEKVVFLLLEGRKDVQAVLFPYSAHLLWTNKKSNSFPSLYVISWIRARSFTFSYPAPLRSLLSFVFFPANDIHEVEKKVTLYKSFQPRYILPLRNVLFERNVRQVSSRNHVQEAECMYGKQDVFPTRSHKRLRWTLVR